ncbi:interleukin-21 receptor isoform X2 [Erinaceus europaeus]|uniref:Interleukin-21 receptor isoform X2 n=1 Tax=Erinaceus europaeus TaxID=9365 RepID=A0ABM3VWX5_ERIEU|nr:interleukin-21 receptor isoform X2 [Erinaceus europaeus]
MSPPPGTFFTVPVTSPRSVWSQTLWIDPLDPLLTQLPPLKHPPQAPPTQDGFLKKRQAPGASMPNGWATLSLLLMLQGAWGCPQLSCFTDYYQTVTCLVETGTLHSSSLTVTWQDQYGELEDEVTSCLLHPSTSNATHTEYTCHMDVTVFMADDEFSVNMTEEPGGLSQECGSFQLSQNIRPSPPFNVSVVPAPAGDYTVTWSTDYDALDTAMLKGKLQFQLQYWNQGDLWARPRTKLVSVDSRAVSLPASEFPGGSRFSLRLRAGPDAFLRGSWSEWSPPAAFHSQPAGLELPAPPLVPPPPPELKGDWRLYLLLVVLLPALVLLALKIHLPWRLCKKAWLQVPSPEWFFQPLYSNHSGDFKKWVGTPFTASSLELGTWNLVLPATLEMASCPPPGPKAPPEPRDPEQDGPPEPEPSPPMDSWACSPEEERPYGLVSIDTVMVDGACEDNGYPALALDVGPGSTLMTCILGGSPVVLGGALGGPESPPVAQVGSPPSLDMDTFDSGFSGSDCGSPVDGDFPGPPDEGPPRSYLRQWVVMAPLPPSPGDPGS